MTSWRESNSKYSNFQILQFLWPHAGQHSDGSFPNFHCSPCDLMQAPSCSFRRFITVSMASSAAPEILSRHLWPRNGLSTTAPTLTATASYRPKHNRCNNRIATQRTHVGNTIGARDASRSSIVEPQPTTIGGYSIAHPDHH